MSAAIDRVVGLVSMGVGITEGELRAALAEARDEGFDAGERDVFKHEQAGWRGDDPCIPNPYIP